MFAHAPALITSVSIIETRKALKESDSVQGIMPIEDYLDRLDPHRSTTLNWPYPLNNTPAPSTTSTEIEPYRDRILSILQSHNLPPKQYLRLSVFSTTKPLYPSRPQKTTLSLQYMTDPYSSKSPRIPPRSTLDLARTAISSFLSDSGIQMEVEIIFLNQFFDPCLFAIENDADDPAVKTFESARRNIQNRVVNKLRGDWQMMKLFSVGVTKEEALPTIVVQVSPFARADWAGMRRQIRVLLAEAEDNDKMEIDGEEGNEKVDIEVEFIPGRPRKEIVYEEEEDELEDAFKGFDEVFEAALKSQHVEAMRWRWKE